MQALYIIFELFLHFFFCTSYPTAMRSIVAAAAAHQMIKTFLTAVKRSNSYMEVAYPTFSAASCHPTASEVLMAYCGGTVMGWDGGTQSCCLSVNIFRIKSTHSTLSRTKKI
jgi:hypothetical protein